jgi:hypothetical protein
MCGVVGYIGRNRAGRRAEAQGDLHIHAEGFAGGGMKCGPIALTPHNLPGPTRGHVYRTRISTTIEPLLLEDDPSVW